MIWRLIDTDLAPPYYVTAADEAILEAFRKNIIPPTIHFYRRKPAGVSVGRTKKIEKDVNIKKCGKYGVKVVRRKSGGGTIYTDEGFYCKNFIEGKGKEITNEFELYRITRCVGYYDCERLGNLRIACESREPVVKSGPFDLLHIQLRPNCSPAEVSIIKSSLKLLDLLEQFERNSTQLSQEMLRHTKEMNRLTKWILAFTAINALMIIIQIILILSRG